MLGQSALAIIQQLLLKDQLVGGDLSVPQAAPIPDSTADLLARLLHRQAACGLLPASHAGKHGSTAYLFDHHSYLRSPHAKCSVAEHAGLGVGSASSMDDALARIALGVPSPANSASAALVSFACNGTMQAVRCRSGMLQLLSACMVSVASLMLPDASSCAHACRPCCSSVLNRRMS